MIHVTSYVVYGWTEIQVFRLVLKRKDGQMRKTTSAVRYLHHLLLYFKLALTSSQKANVEVFL